MQVAELMTFGRRYAAHCQSSREQAAQGYNSDISLPYPAQVGSRSRSVRIGRFVILALPFERRQESSRQRFIVSMQCARIWHIPLGDVVVAFGRFWGSCCKTNLRFGSKNDFLAPRSNRKFDSQNRRFRFDYCPISLTEQLQRDFNGTFATLSARSVDFRPGLV